MDNMSLSDIAAVTRGADEDGWGGGGGGWMMIILFALIFGWGGGGFGGRNANANPVTEADLCNANSFNDLKGAVRGVSGQIDGMNIGLTKGICDLGYTTLANFNGIERQLADCCCTTQRAVDGVRFDMANYAAGTNATVTAGVQKILDRMCSDKEAALAARIQQLEVQQAMCGVVRYPMATTFSAPSNPFFGSCGCGCGGNI